jgi:hypothetical protein
VLEQVPGVPAPEFGVGEIGDLLAHTSLDIGGGEVEVLTDASHALALKFERLECRRRQSGLLQGCIDAVTGLMKLTGRDEPDDRRQCTTARVRGGRGGCRRNYGQQQRHEQPHRRRDRPTRYILCSAHQTDLDLVHRHALPMGRLGTWSFTRIPPHINDPIKPLNMSGWLRSHCGIDGGFTCVR